MQARAARLNEAKRGRMSGESGERREPGETGGERRETGESSGGRGEMGGSSGGRGETAEPSGGRGETAESSGGRGEMAEPSGGRVETAESSGGRGETAEPSGGRGETAESSGGRGETAESSRGGGESVELSSDGSRDTSGEASLYLSEIEDESGPESDVNFDDEKAQNLFDDWVVNLPALDRKMLAVSLSQSFIKRQQMKLTDAVREAASFVGLNEKTVRKYRNDFFTNQGQFPETRRGKYTRESLLSNENLRLDAAMWVRENSYKKGAANMTAASFREWVNNTLLPNAAIPESLPHEISIRTATRWLHQLGFRPQSHKKGAYVDGHEREDVVKSRKTFLDKVNSLKVSHLPPPPCSDERAKTPPLDAESRKRLVLIYHDESIFNTNEGQTWMWATPDTPVIQPKTKGAGVMVSDFIDQHRGFLQLTDDEHQVVKAHDPNFPKSARVLFEYGAEKEGYWTAQKFLNNLKDAVVIAEHVYPGDNHTLVWLFDQSSCHKAFAEDALNARRMNVRPGGNQPQMRDTVWGRKVQTMVMADGTPKGMKMVLEERGINTSRMNADNMRIVLANHEDFRTEKTLVEKYIESRGHIALYIPKFHCELNPIERVWGQAKVYTRKHTNFTLPRLRQIVGPALDSVRLDLIRKYFRTVGDYEKAYMEGRKAGKELEQAVKVFKSHRRIFFEQN